MRKHLRRFILALALVAIVGGLIAYQSRSEPVAVAVAAIERGLVEATVANTRAGTLEAERRAKVAPTTSGQVIRLPVRQGDQVKQGDLLLELRNEDIRAELKAAESRVRAATARANQACELAENAELEAKRLASLKERRLIPLDVADKAISNARAQAAACRAARAETQLAADQVAVTQSHLNRTLLKAPFDGVVAEVNAELGEIVSPSPPGIPTPPAVDLIDLRSLYVSAPIDEVDAPKVKIGLPARITLDALPGQRFAGRVTRIAPYVQDFEKQARTVEVHVAFERPEEAARLLPGYSADAEIILAAHEDTLRVPTEAVLEGGRVLVLPPSGVLEERTIAIGLSNWEWTEVTGGLSAGDRVVLSVNRPGVKAGAEAVAESP